MSSKITYTYLDKDKVSVNKLQCQKFHCLTNMESRKPKMRTKNQNGEPNIHWFHWTEYQHNIVSCRYPTSCMIRIHVRTLVSHGAMHDQQILNLLQPCSFPYLDLSNFIFCFIKNIFLIIRVCIIFPQATLMF